MSSSSFFEQKQIRPADLFLFVCSINVFILMLEISQLDDPKKVCLLQLMWPSGFDRRDILLRKGGFEDMDALKGHRISAVKGLDEGH